MIEFTRNEPPFYILTDGTHVADLKAVDRRSYEFGLVGSRIIKIRITRNGEQLFNYDRGFDRDDMDRDARAFLAQVHDLFYQPLPWLPVQSITRPTVHQVLTAVSNMVARIFPPETTAPVVSIPRTKRQILQSIFGASNANKPQ